MTWTFLGRLRLENNWVLLPQVDSEIFRVSHVQIPELEGKYVKAAIAVGVEIDNRFNPYKPKLLTYSEQPEIIPLEGFPNQVGIPRLAVRRLDDSPVDWDITIEAFPEIKADNNLVDEITQKIMTLFDLESNSHGSGCADNTQLIPHRKIVDCTKNTPILLVNGSLKRRVLIIKNFGGRPLVLGRSGTIDETTGQLTEISERFDEIPGKRGYNMPSYEGCIYKGDIYALPKFDGQVEVMEWRKEIISEDE